MQPLQRVDGTQLHEMLLYPTLDKEPDLSPYPGLLDRFRQALRSAKVLVVIGYAFGDESLQHLLSEALKQNRRLQLLVVEPGERRAGSFFQAHRFVHLKKKLRMALADESLLTIMKTLVQADDLATEGFRAVGDDSHVARTKLTEATARYLAAQHWAGAHQLVMRAVKAIITPPTSPYELLISNWRTLIEHPPAFDDPTAPSWFGLLPYHLDAIERMIVERLEGQLTIEELGPDERITYRPFREDTFRWGPNFEAGDLDWLRNQMLGYARAFPEDQSMRKHAVNRLADQLGRLSFIYAALSQTQVNREDFIARLRPVTVQYRQEQGISVLGETVATELTKPG